MFKKESQAFKKPQDKQSTVDDLVAQPAQPAKPQWRLPTSIESNGPAGRLAVGPDIRLKSAAIEDCDTLIVEGRVEASMDSRVLQIEKSGVFVGAAKIDEAEIHGLFEGDLTARERLIVHRTGRVTGTIRYGRLSIEEGGEIAGDIAAMGSKEPTNVSSLAEAKKSVEVEVKTADNASEAAEETKTESSAG